MDEMTILTAAVSRGVENALVIGDLPFMSYQVSRRGGGRATPGRLHQGGRRRRGQARGRPARRRRACGRSCRPASRDGPPRPDAADASPRWAATRPRAARPTPRGGCSRTRSRWKTRAASRWCWRPCPAPVATHDHRRLRDPHHRHRRRAPAPTARCWCCTTCSASPATATAAVRQALRRDRRADGRGRLRPTRPRCETTSTRPRSTPTRSRPRSWRRSRTGSTPGRSTRTPWPTGDGRAAAVSMRP